MSNHRKVILFQKVAINLSLLPIKGHYFFFFAASACVLPFLPIYGRALGISPLSVGLIYTVLPFLTMATKPIFAVIADRLQRFQLLLIICLALNTLSTLAVLLIPAQEKTSVSTNMSSLIMGTMNCSVDGLTFQVHKQLTLTCVKSLFNSSVMCSSMCMKNCSKLTVPSLDDEEDLHMLDEFCMQNVTLTLLNLTVTNPNITFFTVSYLSKGNSSLDNFQCIDYANEECMAHCDLMTLNCLDSRSNTVEETHLMNTYLSIQFWLFFLFNAVSRVTNGICLALGDATCYEMLEEKVNAFGKQRMWGAIGWGTAALLAGWMNHVARSSQEENFVPGFCMFAVFMAIDFACIMQTRVKSSEPSKSILKDMITLFRKPQVLIFVFCVWIMGVLTGIQWSYSFWYFSDLGASQLLMGLTLTVQCFLGELPFFFFSGWIIQHFGHFSTVIIGIVIFGVRYVLYSFIYNPWLLLPVELAQGPTFGSFYAAMTSFAKENAPSGTEATMQGILGATFIGFGVAMGGLFGGVGFESVGGRLTFRYAGITAACLGVIIFGLAHSPCKKPKSTKRQDKHEDQVVEGAPEEATFLELQSNAAQQTR